MNPIIQQILDEIVQKDYLGRPILDQTAILHSSYDLRTKLNCDPEDFYNILKQMHLNYLIDVAEWRDPNGTVRVRLEGIQLLASIVTKGNPL